MYTRWGYPAWFPYLAALLELTATGLLAAPDTRCLGASLSAIVMIAAAATVLFHGDGTHAVAPLLVLSAPIAVFLTTSPRRA